MGRDAAALDVRLVDRLLRDLTELEEPAAKRDHTGGKPCPAEEEAGDRVREPVHVEKHASARDRDRMPMVTRAATSATSRDGCHTCTRATCWRLVRA